MTYTVRSFPDCKYWIGDIVYHVLSTEIRRGIVTGIKIDPGGIMYYVTWPDHIEHLHFDIEISSEYVPDYEST